MFKKNSIYKKISKLSDFKNLSDDDKVASQQLCMGLDNVCNRMKDWRINHFKSGKEESQFDYTKQMLISDTPDCNQEERDLIVSLLMGELNNE